MRNLHIIYKKQPDRKGQAVFLLSDSEIDNSCKKYYYSEN